MKLDRENKNVLFWYLKDLGKQHRPAIKNYCENHWCGFSTRFLPIATSPQNSGNTLSTRKIKNEKRNTSISLELKILQHSFPFYPNNIAVCNYYEFIFIIQSSVVFGKKNNSLFPVVIRYVIGFSKWQLYCIGRIDNATDTQS